MSIAIRCVAVHLDVDKRVVGFMMPLGAGINMDGVAIGQVVAVIGIAQINNHYLTVGDLLKIW